jgi:hypothetical protein
MTAYRINILPNYRQSFTFKVKDKDINISLYYSENTKAFIMDISYGSFTANGIRIVNNYNILNKYKNILPFGIQIMGEHDPYFIDDFANENNVFLILDEESVKEVES